MNDTIYITALDKIMSIVLSLHLCDTCVYFKIALYTFRTIYDIRIVILVYV